MAAKELVEYVAKTLVDDPDAVTVEVVRDAEGTVIELHVAEDDMGKVIGVLRGKYAGQMDFGKASGMVKARLSG